MNNKSLAPKGRRSLPQELLQFGVHLVYSEGTTTEPYYVDNIRTCIAEKYNRKPNDILLVSANGNKSYHTLDLVKFARQDVEKRLQKKDHIDHVWIMFDKDDFEDFETAHKLIGKLNNSKLKDSEGFNFDEETGIVWHSCWSNQCFELWLRLYFNYYNVQHRRKEYIDSLENCPQLRKIKFKYEKNLEGIHTILTDNGGSLKNAIQNAKKLEQENGIGDPSTGMYKFAEYFENYMK